MNRNKELLSRLEKAKKIINDRDNIQNCTNITIRSIDYKKQCRNVYHIKKVNCINNLIGKQIKQNIHDTSKGIIKFDFIHIKIREPKSWLNIMNVNKLSNNDINDYCTFSIHISEDGLEYIGNNGSDELYNVCVIMDDIQKIITISVNEDRIHDEGGKRIVDGIVVRVRHHINSNKKIEK
jgi:hypothetical protein